MGGGCVSTVFAVQLADGRQVVAKADESAEKGLDVEAAMLGYLARNTDLPVPDVLYSSVELLVLERLPGGSRFSPEAEEDAARCLSQLHQIGAPAYGFGYATRIGGLVQPNNFHTSWVDFFRECRLQHMAAEAAQAHRLPATTHTRLLKLCDQLDRWLVEPAAGPSLVHGDVWTTNVLADGRRITGFLDPAIYFASAEVELAFVALFNTFGDRFFDRYNEHNAIAGGFFEVRRDILNLYPLLVHVRLFGGSYISMVERTLSRFGY